MASFPIPLSKLNPKALYAFEALAREGKCLAFACSGGADSVLLLSLFVAYYPHFKKQFCVFHFNHALRQESSEEDQRHVEHLANQLDLPFYTARGHSDAMSEAKLREERHAFFRSQMALLGGGAILFGQQLNDIVESLLMRLSRGSNLSGLLAPKPVQKQAKALIYLRPLLGLTRADIESTLQKMGISYRSDASNLGNVYYRNRIRNQLLPFWETLAPQDILPAMYRSYSLLYEEEEALDYYFDSIHEAAHAPLAAESKSCDWHFLQKAPQSLHRRAFHRFLLKLSQQGIEGRLSAQTIDKIVLQLINKEDFKESFGSGFLEFKAQCLSYVSKIIPLRPWGPLSLKLGESLVLPDGSSLLLEFVENETLTILLKKPLDFKTSILLPVKKDAIHSLSFQVRSCLPGDRYQPLGAPGSKKVKSQMIDHKIPSFLRSQLPLVCDLKGNAFWSPGLLPSEGSRISPQAACALRLTYQRLSAQ